MRFGLPDPALKIRYWLVRFVPNLGNFGECDQPDTHAKEIRLRSTLKGQELLDTALHEQLHAALWTLDEDFVEKLATQLAANIWKIRDRIFETE